MGETIKVLEVSCSDWLEGELITADSAKISIKTSSGQKDIPYEDIKKAKLNKI